jgi:hypothetical protein
MTNRGLSGLVLLAVCAIAPIAGAQAAAASGGSPQTRYAKVRHLCRAPGPGRAGCLALRLKAASAGTPGALPYVVAAGARSKGPAGGLTPADLASAYSYSPTAGGSGQTVAIVDAHDDPKIEEDLGKFDSHYGLPECTSANGCFTKVNQTGGTQPLPTPNSEWAGEISLDVETVHSVCPNCKILLVEANTEEDQDLGAAVDEAVSLGADEVSNSYGGPEGSEPEDLPAYDHPGVAIVASAGDSGYYDWDDAFEGEKAPQEPDAPASYPTVVAVGGTSLKLNGKGVRKSETVWNNSGRPSSQGVFKHVKQYAASGGGCSLKFTAPAWQQAVANWSATGCETHRLASDVSAVADPYTGFDTYDTYGGETGWMTIGGTSLSAPLVSALYALSGGAHGVSYPAQTLYAQLGNPAALYDVTSGGNGYCDGAEPSECGEPEVNNQLGKVDCLGTTACDAAPGFDGPSGVGAPIGLAAFGGPPVEFAPSAVTGHASPVETESAVLNATVNPNGSNVTACTFEYGPGKTFTQSVPCSSLPGSGTSPVAVSAALGSLTHKTIYSFRISATNGGGTTVGKAKKLKTH